MYLPRPTCGGKKRRRKGGRGTAKHARRAANDGEQAPFVSHARAPSAGRLVARRRKGNRKTE